MASDRYKFFRVEARELLDGLTKGVLELEKGAAVKEQVALLLRLAHTLKGTSRVVKQIAMGAVGTVSAASSSVAVWKNLGSSAMRAWLSGARSIDRGK